MLSELKELKSSLYDLERRIKKMEQTLLGHHQGEREKRRERPARDYSVLIEALDARSRDDIKEGDLVTVFGQYGKIYHVYPAWSYADGRHFTRINYYTRDEMEACLSNRDMLREIHRYDCTEYVHRVHDKLGKRQRRNNDD